MTTHAALSPSKSARWLACPGSIREEAKYPDGDSGPAAVDGTHTHSLLEYCIRNPDSDPGVMDPDSLVGTSLTDHEGTFVIDRERVARVKMALAYIYERKGPFGVVLPEKKVNPAHLLGRDDMGGTVDVTILTDGALEIIDYKDGMGVVAAEGNTQLELYALGVLAELGLPVNGNYPFTNVRLTIIQPKLAVKGMPAISYCDTTVSEILGKIGKFAAGAHATDNPDAPLVSGDHCKFCKHKACTQRANDVMKEVGVMFQAIDTNVVDVAQQSADKNPLEMTDEQIKELMVAAPLLRQLLDAVDEEALRRFNSGHPIAGLKPVSGRGSRNWSLPDDEMAEKLTKMGVPKSAVFVTKVVTPAQAPKLIWEKKDGTKKQLTERQIKTLETEYIVKNSGKLTIVPESDPRPAVVLDASPLFSAVPVTPVVDSLPAWLL